jgi:phosphatidylinositol glycan class M
MQPIPRLLLLSAALRAALIAWGVVQDTYLQVKYTDVDYNVFTDAARFVVAGESPFLRSTYRYSPLLAYVVLPNILVTSIWGKVRHPAPPP